MSCFGGMKKRQAMAWHATPGGMRDHGSRARWLCQGCEAWTPFDLDEYIGRVGERYELWNELSACPCGAPRTLHVSPGAGTPFRPNKDEWLWVSRELNYGKDPDAWFEIMWMVDW